MDGEYTVATDKKEKIKLESRIVSADWLSSFARGGAEAELRVKTVFVAEGSAIEIIGHSTKGKAPGTIKGKIFNDEFIGKLLIPEKVSVDAEIWFEAKLPKHGLKEESGTSIPARPPILASKICWDKDTVKRGDLVKVTCQFESGVQDGEDAIFVIYEHNPNSYDFKVTSFQTTIKNNKAEATWLFNYQDDTAQIPTHVELQPSNKSYHNPDFFFVVVVDGVRIGEGRESGLMKFQDFLDFNLFDHHDILLRDHDVEIQFANGSKIHSRSDAQGHVHVESLGPGPTKIHYETRDYESLEIKFDIKDCSGKEVVLFYSTDPLKTFSRQIKLDDDGTVDEDYIIINFFGIDGALSYTMEIYNEKMEKITTAFENAPFGTWISTTGDNNG